MVAVCADMVGGICLNSISVLGGNQLYGKTCIQGSKNAVLPILAATVLIQGTTIIHNCPQISDVTHMLKLLEVMGCQVKQDKNVVSINASNITSVILPEEYVDKMRSSIILLGALLGRMGEAVIGYPGGCTIGERPIDLHKMALERMGATFEEENQVLVVRANELQGIRITLPIASVGATENIILAAVTAKGYTQIFNCAMEPEIVALCTFLNKAGAKIYGVGTNHLVIEGSENLQEIEFQIEPDRIVAGTYLLAGSAIGGDFFLENMPSRQLHRVIQYVEEMGVIVKREKEGVRITRQSGLQTIPFIETKQYPGFPTDLQSPMIPLLLCAKGQCKIKESIFSSRFGVTKELNQMGANIQVIDNYALVNGTRELKGNHVFAQDLRGGAALVIAGMVASGNTIISNIHYIERGYEDITHDLYDLGANIRKVSSRWV
ncbi:MAG: UDP-N-acetylglucosamine 1-carboxyvinyltransferase [Eubacteriales bacterium]